MSGIEYEVSTHHNPKADLWCVQGLVVSWWHKKGIES
jgi:hypothetical protein